MYYEDTVTMKTCFQMLKTCKWRAWAQVKPKFDFKITYQVNTNFPVGKEQNLFRPYMMGPLLFWLQCLEVVWMFMILLWFFLNGFSADYRWTSFTVLAEELWVHNLSTFKITVWCQSCYFSKRSNDHQSLSCRGEKEWTSVIVTRALPCEISTDFKFMIKKKINSSCLKNVLTQMLVFKKFTIQ
jgi:hypothetical protein